MKRIIKVLFTLVIILTISNAASAQSKEFEISKNLDIYATLLKELQLNYVDEIKPGELNETAINAMLHSVDPYTVFIAEADIEDYKFMTTGQYGGIGAMIQKRTDYVIISEPYQGFPAEKAGLMAGDKIMKIDDKDVQGKNADEVSQLMKGQPGTSFVMTILRNGQQLEKNITREKIKIENVPYYGVVGENTGYIKLTGFTENAGLDVMRAFNDLKENHQIESVIIDLRNNGGGLLNEAVNIMDIFVDKGEVIVNTKGKLPDKNKTYKTRRAAVDTDIPLAVLVNGHSASASEIVSGSMQDLDRGVLVGERTFGKGLVQNILPLSYNTKMKVTVAKYYIPSGRCIQEIDYSSNRDENGEYEAVADSLIKKYETKNGRVVYDGKGIRPDVEINPGEASRIAFTLFAKNHIFDFATQYRQQHDSIPAAADFVITDAIYDEFLKYLDGKDFEYTTETELALKALIADSKTEKYYEFIKEPLENLEKELQAHKSNDLITFKEDIKRFLRGEIVSRYYYQKGTIIANLNDDIQLDKAIEILNDKPKYQSILDGTYKTEE